MKLSRKSILLVAMLLLIAGVVIAEMFSEPLDRPLYNILPGSRPMLGALNGEPVRLNKTKHVQVGHYAFGGAAGGTFAAVRVCKSNRCETLLAADGDLGLTATALSRKAIAIAAHTGEFEIWYPSQCQNKAEKRLVPNTWTCTHHGVDMEITNYGPKPAP